MAKKRAKMNILSKHVQLFSVFLKKSECLLASSGEKKGKILKTRKKD